MHVCATTRAKLAEAGTTPAKEMELKRIAKGEKWMELREKEGVTVKADAEMVDEPPPTLSRWKDDTSVKSPRPDTLRKSKRSPEVTKAVLEVRQEQKAWARKRSKWSW